MELEEFIDKITKGDSCEATLINDDIGEETDLLYVWRREEFYNIMVNGKCISSVKTLTTHKNHIRRLLDRRKTKTVELEEE